MGIRPQLTIGEVARRAVETQVKNGFPTPGSIKEREALLAKLMLVVTEAAEAAEVLRSTEANTERQRDFLKECVDIVIRTCAIAGGITAPSVFARMVREKLDFNDTRNFRHGKAI